MIPSITGEATSEALNVVSCADDMGRAVRVVALSALLNDTNMERHMSQAFHASKSLTALEQDSTIINRSGW